MTRASIALLALLVAAPVSAEEPTPFKWPAQHRPIADTISDIAVYAQLGLDFTYVVFADDQARAFKCHALRMGLTFIGVGLTKKFIPRTRPDGSNDLSFYSGHSAFAAAASGWR